MLDRLANALGDAYAVERELGRGGMATVYLAMDRRHGRQVAIKVLRPELTAMLERERFLREIEIAATLVHPNILPLHDSGEADGILYFVMPYIEGRSLADRLSEGPLAIDDAIRIARQVARALHYAHQRGVVHRDIKPANILLVDDQALVADFGIARAAESVEADRLTSTGLSVGTPHYMSPEQAAAEREVDGRADIYSLGCVLFEMVAGRPPFERKTAHALLVQHALEPAPSVGTLRLDVPRTLGRIIAQALEKSPDDRFVSAEELENALESVRGGTATLRWRPRRRTGRVVALVAASAALVLVAAIAFQWRGRAGADSTLDADLIAVAPFRVTGPEGASFADLEAGVPELLYMRLGGDGGPRTVYPGTAATAWERVRDGGELTDSAALRGARALGAGQLMLGHVLVSGGELVMNATLFSVPDGVPVAHAADVRGPVDSLVSVTDRLSVELLMRSAGEPEQRLAHFMTVKLPAVRAYFAGQEAYHESRFADAVEHLIRAIDIDSTFALAGLQLAVADSYVGPSTRGAVRGLNLAWAHRDRLTARDQVFLDALGGPAWPQVSPMVELVRAWEAAAEAAPDRKEVQFQLGDYLFHYGPWIGASAAWERAEAAFRRVLAIDPSHSPALGHLFELAAAMGDTAAAREHATRYMTGSTRDYRAYYRWRLAHLRQDTAYLVSFQDSIIGLEDLSLERIDGSGQMDGAGIEAAELAARTLHERGGNLAEAYDNLRYLALNRGRPSEALEWRRHRREQGRRMWDPLMDVIDAVYWGGDSATAARAVADRAYVDEASRPAGPIDPRGDLYVDLCAVSLWRAAHGERERLPRAIDLLRDAAQRSGPRRSAFPQLCAALLDAELASAAGRSDAPAAVARLDSLSALGLQTSWELEAVANLTLARLRERQGDLDGALAAVRRRSYAVDRGKVALSTFFREEGALAAAAGDTAGATRAYRAYLNLRSDPEPALLPEADRVRAELARLERGVR